MSLSSNPPSDWPAVSELLDEALALPAHELDAWFDSLQGAQLACKDEVRTLLGLLTFVDRENFLGQLPALKDPLPALPSPGRADAVAGSVVGPYRLIAELGRGG